MKEISEPLILGKSWLIADNLRFYKNTDSGYIPWAGGKNKTSTSGCAAEDKIEFFENAAKPPTKRDRQNQSIPGFRTSRSLNVAKKKKDEKNFSIFRNDSKRNGSAEVVNNAKERRPVNAASMASKRGRPSGGNLSRPN